MKNRKPKKRAMVATKLKRTPIVSKSTHDASVERTGLLRGDHDDVGRADLPTDYDDPDVCYQIAMNNPRA